MTGLQDNHYVARIRGKDVGTSALVEILNRHPVPKTARQIDQRLVGVELGFYGLAYVNGLKKGAANTEGLSAEYTS